MCKWNGFGLSETILDSGAMCREAAYGRLLAKYMDDESNIFIISSDFCHWGSRFSYTFNDSSKVDTLHVSLIQSPHSERLMWAGRLSQFGTDMLNCF